jgi:mannose-6-phosphate isomerase-like protein (cupin superfamily)
LQKDYFMSSAHLARAILVSAALSVSGFAVAQEPTGFMHLTPQDVHWSANPSIPPGGQSALIYGDPRRGAPYITRVKLPANYRVLPHSHPEERVYTVISGTFYIGFGNEFDQSKLFPFPAGSVFVVPANQAHFHLMQSGEAIVQISGTGPSGIEYVNHEDDPRH